MAILHELAQEGGKQSLSHLITLTDVATTPFTSAIPKAGKLVNTEHKTWLKKTKRIGHKGVMSTADVENFTTNGRKPASMFCQIFRDGAGVSTLVDNVVEVDGLMRSEMAEQIADSLGAVKLAKEQRFLSNEDSSVDDNDSTANETRGMVMWGSPTAQTHSPVPEDFRPAAGQQYAGTLAALDEEAFLDILEAAYSNKGGRIEWDFHCGIQLKRSFRNWLTYAVDKAGYTTIRTNSEKQPDPTTVKRMVNFLQTDMGDVKLIPNENIMCDEVTGQPTAYSPLSGVGFEPGTVKEAQNKVAKWNKLENQGGGPRGYVDEVSTLINYNPSTIITCKINAAS